MQKCASLVQLQKCRKLNFNIYLGTSASIQPRRSPPKRGDSGKFVWERYSVDKKRAVFREFRSELVCFETEIPFSLRTCQNAHILHPGRLRRRQLAESSVTRSNSPGSAIARSPRTAACTRARRRGSPCPSERESTPPKSSTFLKQKSNYIELWHTLTKNHQPLSWRWSCGSVHWMSKI